MLLAEYAIEPEAILTWERFRYITEKCGVQEGRLISDFPGDWCSVVRDSIRGIKDEEVHLFPPVARSKALNTLRGLKKNAVIDLGRTFDSARSWQDNALSSHEQIEFKAIIASTPESAGMLDISLLDTSDEAWKVPRELAVPRTAEDLSMAASYLLMMSNNAVFVDPYFSPEDRRCRKPLMAFLEHMLLPITRLEFHLCRRNSGSAEHFLDMLQNKLLPDLRRLSDFPNSQSFFFIRWNELPTGDGEAVHPRYILTDKGGLRFEHGLSEAGDHETTDVSLLDNALYEQRLSQYRPDCECFEFADGWCIQNGTVFPITIKDGEWSRV